jgi:carbonic anhydrase
MVDIVYRYVPGYSSAHPSPASPAEARERLEDGNRSFASALSGDAREPRVMAFDLPELGAPGAAPSAPKQAPFAVVLGCSDARVPTELVFSQAWNDLFVVRVAGNVLGSECLGSIDYAMSHLSGSLRLLVVLGHRGCGAVAAAVDAFLTPGHYLDLATSHSIRSIVDRISIAVRTSARTLETVYGIGVARCPGYREALSDMTVVVNAALTAHTLGREFAGRPDCRAVFGVYDIASRRVCLPVGSEDADETRLVAPPADRDGFVELLTRLASGPSVRRTLDGVV